MSLPSPSNPFEDSADPRGYVPRAACEGVLGSLERQLEAGVPVIVLRGPAGIGKSMLLSVLHQSLGEAWRVAQVAVSPSPSVEISHRILDLLDVDVDSDPSSTLVATARRFARSGRRVLVIIDPATHVPVASSRQLARAAARAGGDLCVLFAVTEGEGMGAEAFEGEIGAEAEFATVRLDVPMNAQETADYIERRLDQTLDSGALHDRFDDAVFRYVIEGAAGNPRQVNELAFDALRRLERGEALPVRDADPAAPAEFTTGSPASPAPSSASLLQRGASTYVDPPLSEHSLGGGLLGAGPARDPRERDAARELFPPGFLRSDRDPLPPARAPAPDDAGAARDGGEAERAEGNRQPQRRPLGSDAAPSAASAVRDGAAAVDERAASDATATLEPEARIEPGSAVEREAVPEVAGVDREDVPKIAGVMREAAPEIAGAVDGEIARDGAAAVDAEPARQGAAPAASTNRTKLWVAALIAMAAAGGYLAGRVDPAAVESSPLPAAPPTASPTAPPAARPAAAPTSVAGDAAPIAAARATPPVQPDRAELDAQAGPAAVAPAAPAPEAAAPPIASSDAGASAIAARPPVETRALPDAATTASSPPPSREANAPADADALAAASVPAAAPGVQPDPPRAAPPPPSPAPAAAPRAEDTRAVDASRTPGQPAGVPEPGAPVDRGRSIADGSVTAIVVGARGAGELRPSAYVRVRVELEAGARLSIDGEPVGVAPFSDLIMEPGPHTFVAELPDGLQIEQLIQVTPETGVVEF